MKNMTQIIRIARYLQSIGKLEFLIEVGDSLMTTNSSIEETLDLFLKNPFGVANLKATLNPFGIIFESGDFRQLHYHLCKGPLSITELDSVEKKIIDSLIAERNEAQYYDILLWNKDSEEFLEIDTVNNLKESIDYLFCAGFDENYLRIRNRHTGLCLEVDDYQNYFGLLSQFI